MKKHTNQLAINLLDNSQEFCRLKRIKYLIIRYKTLNFDNFESKTYAEPLIRYFPRSRSIDRRFQASCNLIKI